MRCYARTRVPTPHGEVFCHLYRNNHDRKEHLALVVDWEQNDEEAMLAAQQQQQPSSGASAAAAPAAVGKLRSRTLEEKWSAEETDMERIVRGAYVGRLGPTFQRASQAMPRRDAHAAAAAAAPPSAQESAAMEDAAALVRIHSECYTGETIGSQRCDCGEQLDEAIRLISSSGPSYASGKPRGIVVYLRQEGRGIGLLDKLMAYNLQDMGHDTVTANILLGHLPDARKYDIASAILRDLGVEQCRLLTNNPEKMEALEAEGVRVTERVPMVPRMWRRSAKKIKKLHAATEGGGSGRASRRHKAAGAATGADGSGSSQLQHSIISQFDHEHEHNHHHHNLNSDLDDYDESDDSDASVDSYVDHALRRSGATMLGGSVTRGPELEKYLRTKVERMGHMLELPPEEEEEGDAAGQGEDRNAAAAARFQDKQRRQQKRLQMKHAAAGGAAPGGIAARRAMQANAPGHGPLSQPSTPAAIDTPPLSGSLADLRGDASAAHPLLSSSLSSGGAGGRVAFTRRTSGGGASAASVGSQPESILGESEILDIIKDSASVGSADVPPSGQSSRSAGGSPEALASALQRLTLSCQKVVDSADTFALLEGHDGGDLKEHFAALSVEHPNEVIAHAEELMEIAGNALATADMEVAKQSSIAQLGQIVLHASKVVKVASSPWPV